jgi:hypothetical protein
VTRIIIFVSALSRVWADKPRIGAKKPTFKPYNNTKIAAGGRPPPTVRYGRYAVAPSELTM